MSIYWMLLSIAIVFLSISLGFVFIAKRKKQDLLLPHGRIIYDDLNGSPSSLYSHKYPLVGKPDLILKRSWKRIPVEVKTGNHHTPQPHHVMQLLSYCQLIKENYHRPSPYGYLLYSNTNKRFKIPFNHKQKKLLKLTINQMEKTLRSGKVIRNHDNRRKCNSCLMKYQCQEKIK